MKKKKNFKIVSIITIMFVMMTLISLKGLITKATVASKPEFDITFSPIPESARVGEDIVVKGTITPKPFEMPVQQKEILFVVDKDPLNNGKLTSLMSETKNFIDSIAENDKFNNIKTAIIEYDKEAQIYRENKVAFLDLKIETQRNNIVKKLSGIGKGEYNKTNTGEALRQALYLLNSDESVKNANKTIIFISDSMPTARTVYNNEKYGDFYTDTTSDKHGNATTDNSNDVNEDLKYAKKMAEMINNKGYNVFTIAYGLDKDNKGEPALRQIHEAMSGNNLSNKDNDKKNGFYISSDNKDAVANMFTEIADRVLQNYSLNNIDMNLNFTGDFSINITGNTVNLSNVNYQLKSVSNGKARYEADPIPFELVINGNREGYQQIFDKVTISYPWQGLIEKVDINSELFITIKPNELPSIVPKLISGDKIETKRDGEITLRYEITPEDFVYNNVSNSGEKDILFLIDVADVGKNKELIEYVKPQIHNQILSQLQNTGAKYSIITFNNEANILFDFNYVPNINDGGYENSINEKYVKKISVSGSESNIGKALVLAQQVLLTGRASASKNIVIISNNNVSYTQNDYNNINNKGYNIITLALNQDDRTSTLYTLHKALNGADGNIMFANNDGNDINNKLMGYVREKIKAFSAIRPYEFKPIINLNLGNKFNPKLGIVRSTESGKSNIGIVEVPTITYNLTQNNNYHASTQTIEIKIKANDLSPGIYTFGNITDNTMTYKNLLNKDVSMTIKTPIIIVKDEIKDVSHGLYNGINNGKVSISETNKENLFEISQGSTVTFGAKFTFSGSTEFNLNVDKNIQGVYKDNIKIYKISNGELKDVPVEDKTITGENNQFKISIKTDNNTEILVVYQGKIIDRTPSGQILTNDIVFGSTSKNATIVTPQNSDKSPILPDLF